MRIIAGEARGRSLIAPRGMDTRPTLDRVRESLFNILRPYIEDSRVLDLFAGSGALGLEALSRGAAHAVFVDNARPAQEAVARNLSALRMEERSELYRCDWRAALARLGQSGDRFDLGFLDPPYRLERTGAMLASLRESGVLAGGALLVYEYARELPPQTAGWLETDRRDYGDTSIVFLREIKEEEAHADGAIPGEL